jgi:hypothetical protein
MTSVIRRNITDRDIRFNKKCAEVLQQQQVDSAEGSWNNDAYPTYVPKKKPMEDKGVVKEENDNNNNNNNPKRSRGTRMTSPHTYIPPKTYSNRFCYCDERGIYKFYFITIAENIHLQFNKFRFVLTTSNCFWAIYEFHLFPF